MIKDYKKIIDYSKTLDQMIELLLDYKEKGELVYCDFNGHILYSDTVTMDSAYLEICGVTKEEFDKQKEEALQKYELEKEMRRQKELSYKQRVLESNGGEPRELKKETIINGLKLICENRDLSQDELFELLLEVGCDFTLEDVQREIDKHPEQSNLLFDGIKNGCLSAGGSIICNVRDSEFGRDYCEDRFLSIDNEISVYGLIRKLSGDLSYTKNNIKAKVKTLK